LLVQKTIYDEFVGQLIEKVSQMTVGDPLDMTSQIGAVASQAQLEKNLSIVQTAKDEGGKVLLGGKRMREDSGGFYMEPTIIADVSMNMKVCTEEVFGPVLAVMPFETEDEAVSIANATEFGLSGGVWTGNLARAHRMIKAIQTGLLHVNTYGGSDMTVPLGGWKQSGNGHDKSLHALEKFTNIKSAWINIAG
jgi:gamma-glutamyl-gamma-aminobutyraldehyde dehydrogenase